jgi:sigma-E factor negative regulatory protein RseC
MIEEIGIVSKVEGVTARVIVQKRSACDGCTAKGTCTSQGDTMEIEALNAVHAKEGQSVKVSMKPQTYLKGTMLVYGLPLVFFITGAIVGKNIGEEYFKEASSDLVAAITGFAALFVSLAGIKIWAKKAERNIEYKPIIEEIMSARVSKFNRLES